MDVFNLADGQLNESQLLDRKKKKNLYPLSKYFSFSISILSAWENPMKLFLRDGTDTNLFTPLGGSHRPFLTPASRKDVLRE